MVFSGQRAHLLVRVPSSNTAVAYVFSAKFVFEKDENKQKEVLGCWSI